jgi:hypothetical protein
MVKITKTAAYVLHGHPKKKGSKTDKKKGAVIHKYSFSKYGKSQAIEKARAQHYAIMMSQAGK